MTKASTEPLRTIYKEILQPLIGDFFEVDAALPSTDVMPRDGLINKNEDELRCCCCVPRSYHSTPTTDRGESVRSDGKYSSYFEIKIYMRSLIIIFLFSVNRNSK